MSLFSTGENSCWTSEVNSLSDSAQWMKHAMASKGLIDTTLTCKQQLQGMSYKDAD